MGRLAKTITKEGKSYVVLTDIDCYRPQMIQQYIEVENHERLPTPAMRGG